MADLPADDVETRRCTVDAALHGQRLDKALVAMAPEFSRSHLQQLLERGHVHVDGQVAAAASRRVRLGQRLLLDLVPTEESQAFRPQPMALAVLFEDEHLLVLNKPAGLVVHPAPGNWSGTLLNGVLAHHAGAAALPRAGIVHRLDKDTSGVMMLGKTLAAVTALVRDIAARTVHRRYLALAHGEPAQSTFSVEAPIGRDPQVRVRMAVLAGGRPARTDVTLLAHLSHEAYAKRLAVGGDAGGASGDASGGSPGGSPGGLPGGVTRDISRGGIGAYSCRLHTGRTHQIRVHMAHSGLPLLADALYGGRPALGLMRQALHAAELALAHPATRAALRFECPPPADFAAGWAQVVGSSAG